MAYKANVYNVFIASPGDVPEERDLAREVVHEWNCINALDKRTCLLPIGWEYNSSPEMGGRAQEILNKQILEASDLLVGIFWTRIGSPTGAYTSGSVEEIEKHVEAGKPAMLYFSNKPVVPDSINFKQYEELQKFKERCFDKGLVEYFGSLEEFRYKLTRQLSLRIIQDDYFKATEETLFEDNADYRIDDQNLIRELTDSEKLLLLEASKDPSGNIIKVSYMGGFDVQTNSKILNKPSDPRDRALWEHTFNNLISKRLIEEKGFKGEMFVLTFSGYKIAEELNNSIKL